MPSYANTSLIFFQLWCYPAIYLLANLVSQHCWIFAFCVLHCSHKHLSQGNGQGMMCYVASVTQGPQPLNDDGVYFFISSLAEGYQPFKGYVLGMFSVGTEAMCGCCVLESLQIHLIYFWFNVDDRVPIYLSLLPKQRICSDMYHHPLDWASFLPWQCSMMSLV